MAPVRTPGLAGRSVSETDHVSGRLTADSQRLTPQASFAASSPAPSAVGEYDLRIIFSSARRAMPKTFKIAVIPGDGIGKEVMPEAMRVLNVAAKRFGIRFEPTHIHWASCDHYLKTGAMMPDDWKAQIGGMDALLFGAVGWPETVPDHVSLWGSLLKFRREFDQYINLRPVRLFDGVPCPLVDKQGKPRRPGDIDFFVVRENTEGEYTNLGGRIFEGTEREIVIQESVFSRHGTDRVMKYAFELAQSRPRKHLTVATKSNGIAISMPWWDGRADAMGKSYPKVTIDKQHIDILCARFVLEPTRFDVVVASNLFGDILSDLGPACTGTIGLAPSTNLNPERNFPSLFEPVHGSAPDIYGRNIANPIAMIWSAALMLDFLYEGKGKGHAAHDAIVTAIETVLSRGPRTADLGGNASTTEAGQAIAALVDKAPV
jgi:tartrate dehydrogenase/decarboxylase/D-malate dehydrogenase